jgi:hypothetical protein
VQDQQTHATKNALLYTINDRIVDAGMGRMAPPGEHIGAIEDFLGQTMFWLILSSSRNCH